MLAHALASSLVPPRGREGPLARAGTCCADQTEFSAAAGAWVADSSGATTAYGDITDWDTSQVTDIFAMFAQTTHFNADLSRWDVSGVTDMSYLFSGARLFDQSVSSWETRAVRSMRGMFAGMRALW